MFFLATYEMLLQLKGSSTDEFAPVLAESWEISEDQSTYTFKLAPGATFHDGTPCDAEAVKGSFTRFLLQGAGPVNVINRFVQDPEQMEVVDATTIRFNLGRPQPLFLAAMASEYGPFVVNPAAIEANKTEEDPFAHGGFRRTPPAAAVSRHGICPERAGRPRAVRRLPQGLGRRPARSDSRRPRERDPPPAHRER